MRLTKQVFSKFPNYSQRRIFSSFENISPSNETYQKIYKESIENPREFWEKAANQVQWYREWDSVLDDSHSPFNKWFSGAKLNTCYNALDYHVENGRKDQLALIYDSPVTNTIKKYTYEQLLKEVAKFAGVLKNLGLEKGDTAIIYMPMIPEAVIAMLACSRIGVIHSVVFGGFASAQLSQRIFHADPKIVIGASCGFGPTGPILYKPLLDKALEQNEVPNVIIYQRPGFECELKPKERDWNVEMSKAQPVPCVSLNSNDPLYMIYTSGTTGTPKGIVRDNGGHLVAMKWSISNIFGINPGDTWFAASDIGWVVGHSYIVYGPLIHGATSVLFEGKPVGTPDAGVFFRIISEHNVKCFFTAPTALRAVIREDPEGNLIKNYDLKNFKTLFLAGERSDPDTLAWAERKLKVPVIDNWWQSESGWPMASNVLGIGNSRFPTKYGSACKSVPGNNIKVLDDHGQPVKNGELGNIVVSLPLPPGYFTTLYKNLKQFKKAYFDRFPGYYNTGDAGYIDDDNYIYIMTRTDDIINVGGIRLSTGAIEEVLSHHSAVAECCVVGPNDEYRGQIPVGFIVLKNGVKESPEKIYEDLVKQVREKIGPVANFKKVISVPLLPKTRSGKILRVVIKNMANGLPPNPPATIEDINVIDQIKESLKELGYPEIKNSTNKSSES